MFERPLPHARNGVRPKLKNYNQEIPMSRDHLNMASTSVTAFDALFRSAAVSFERDAGRLVQQLALMKRPARRRSIKRGR